ncbi:MAG: DedA family protein [Prevotellaceae bacterium]|jgi:membrane protein YqaA with SNARE-associated domain|nr:DedA family protein [Prevotellaceae bacterium]
MSFFIDLGYLGLFLVSFLASTIIPLSSDAALTGLIYMDFNVWTCILIATAGNFLGGLTTYGLGYLGKWEFIEKYFKKSKTEIAGFQRKVKRYGIIAAAFSWLPFVGDMIALSLGFLRIKPAPVFAMMLLGRFIRFVVVGLVAAQIF